MESKILTMLNAEIEQTLKSISEAKASSDEAKAALFKLEKLHAQRMQELTAEINEAKRQDDVEKITAEMDMRETELYKRARQAESELEVKKLELAHKEAELNEAKKGRRWRTVLDIFAIGTPLAVNSYWMAKGLKFEEEGKIYSSRTTQFLSGFTRLFKKNG